MSRYYSVLIVLLTAIAGAGSVRAEEGLDVRMPVVEDALAFIESASLAPVPRAALLRAGAMRVCGKDFSRPGCRPVGTSLPVEDAVGPDAERAFRSILEAALASESIHGGQSFDKPAFERFVVDGMVDSLADPNAFFVAPSIYKKIAVISADFVGFGMRLVLRANGLEIAAVHDGSPARSAGLRAGERIVTVAQRPTTGYHRPVALAALWGADGNEIELEVEDHNGQRRALRLVYKPWAFEPFSTHREGAVAVVRIRHLERGLGSAVSALLADPSVRALVLDLRQAGGGDESVTVALADLLLGEGPLGGKRTRLGLGAKSWKTVANSPGERLDLPLAVVVDEHTSGLPELLASALRISGRAVLVGQRTAGLPTQETLRPLIDGSAVQVTSMAFVGPGDVDLTVGVAPHVRSTRPDVVELAASILTQAKGPSVPELLEAARALVAHRAKAP